MINDLEGEIVRQLVAHWQQTVQNESYNGLKLLELALDQTDPDFVPALSRLVENRKIDILGLSAGNSHIKRLEAPPVDVQIAELDIFEKYHTCIYPTRELASTIDFGELRAKPFSFELAQAVPELSFKFFSVGVLDRYQTDPRYHYIFEDYSGSISAKETASKKDNIYLQSFGLGVTPELEPVVAAFPRYLSELSVAHQQYWKSFEYEGDALPHKNYYIPSIVGDFYVNNSSFNAIREIIRISNEAATAAFGKRLFVREFPEETSQYLSSFMKPTRAAFSLFCLELEKFTVSSINWKFFEGIVETHETIREANGTERKVLRGTLTMLKDWLSRPQIRFGEEGAVQQIISPLRELRKKRQTPAHEIITDAYDTKLYAERRELLADITFSLGSIMRLLLRHPEAGKHDVPKWLKSQEIEYL